MIETGQDIYRSETHHPPSYRRLERIPRYVLGAFKDYWNLQPESVTQFNQMIDQSQQLDSVVEVLWDKIKPQLLDLHSKGVKIAPAWLGAGISFRCP